MMKFLQTTFAIFSILFLEIFVVNSLMLKVGAIFEDVSLVRSFLAAIADVNQDPNILPGIQLQAIINITKPLDAFDNLKAAQYLGHLGVVAIVGPFMSSDVKYTQPYFSGFHIPQFAPVATDPTFSSIPANFPYLVRMSPSDIVQCKALAGLIEYFNWTQFALLVSKDDYGINGVLALKDEAYKRGWLVVAHEHFEPIADPFKLRISKQLKWIRQTGTRIVVLNCYKKYSRQILKQAGDLGMTKDWVWIVTDAQTEKDWQTLGDEFFINQFYGVIGTRLAFGEGTRYKEVAKHWKSYQHGELNVVSGKVFDSTFVLASALHHMVLDGYDVTGEDVRFNFNEGRVLPWRNGEDLMKYIKKVNRTGIMNDLEFEQDGSPKFKDYDIVNLGRTGFVEVGKWSPRKGIVMYPEKPVLWLSQSLKAPRDRADTVENVSIRVVTVVEPPFIEQEDAKTGEKVYTGYCIELLDRLQLDMKFKYTIEVLPVNVYGSKDSFSQKWNGMMEYLVDRKADLSIGPLTISPLRQTAVDFTQPFMHLGFTILVRKDFKEDYKMFSFLKPFNSDLWIAMAVATILVGFFLWLHSTFSPRGYHGRIAQSRDYTYVKEDHWSTRDCLRLFQSTWSSFSYAVGQGADTAHPESTSGRVVAAFWWFAVLIISASYTANLASFLITDVFDTPIDSLEDLASQTKIKYGCIKDSHIMTFFQMSHVPVHAKMWAFMQRHDTLVKNMTEGIQRTKEGGYAFIGESEMLEYYTKQKPCDTLTTIGRVFGKFGYGFGLPKNSPYTEQFSVKILELQQKGFMQHLRERWLQGVCKTPYTESDASLSNDNPVMAFHDMAGVFYAILFGQFVSLLVLLGELAWEAHKDVKKSKASNILQGIKSRLVKSWKSKRQAIATHRSYSLEPSSHWNIALEQLQKLLPDKKADDTSEQTGSRRTKNGLDRNRNRKGAQLKGDLSRAVNKPDIANQHSSKPSTYI